MLLGIEKTSQADQTVTRTIITKDLIKIIISQITTKSLIENLEKTINTEKITDHQIITDLVADQAAVDQQVIMLITRRQITQAAVLTDRVKEVVAEVAIQIIKTKKEVLQEVAVLEGK